VVVLIYVSRRIYSYIGENNTTPKKTKKDQKKITNVLDN
jgi:hypothetical protein